MTQSEPTRPARFAMSKKNTLQNLNLKEKKSFGVGLRVGGGVGVGGGGKERKKEGGGVEKEEEKPTFKTVGEGPWVDG